MIFQVKDLSPEPRQAAEILLGHPLAEDEPSALRALDHVSKRPFGARPQSSLADRSFQRAAVLELSMLAIFRLSAER